MKISDTLIIIIFVILLTYVANTPVEKKLLFNKYNKSFIDRVSPPITGNGLEKPFYERAVEIILKGPSFLFPKVPWLGYVLIFGGLYILWLKYNLILTRVKRKIIYEK